jgi:hypothetical protein
MIQRWYGQPMIDWLEGWKNDQNFFVKWSQYEDIRIRTFLEKLVCPSGFIDKKTAGGALRSMYTNSDFVSLRVAPFRATKLEAVLSVVARRLRHDATDCVNTPLKKNSYF